MRITHGLESSIAASASDVWEIVGDFGSQDWVPGSPGSFLLDGPVSGPGVTRRIETSDGHVIVERLQRVDLGQQLTYSFVGTPAIPVT